MAATDTYRHFLGTLPQDVKDSLRDLLRETGEELLAARSEDARNRIVEAFIREVQVRRAQRQKKK